MDFNFQWRSTIIAAPRSPPKGLEGNTQGCPYLRKTRKSSIKYTTPMECQESRVKKLLVVIYNYVYLIPLTFSIIYIVWPTLNTYKGPCVSKFAVVPKSHRTDSNFFVRSIVRAPDSCPCSCIASMFVYLTRSVAAKRRRLEHPGTIPTAT